MEEAIRQLAERYSLKNEYKGNGLDRYFDSLEIAINSVQMQIKLKKIINAIEKTEAPGDMLTKAAVLNILRGVYIGDEHGEEKTAVL